MTTSVSPDSPAYKPTATQLARAKALRRFNMLYVYLPVGLLTLGLLVLIGLLLWGALSPNVTGTREFVSGMADLILIMTVIPLMLLCAIVPLGFAGIVIYRRQQPKTGEHGRLHTLLWRLDALITRLQTRLDNDFLPKLTQPLITGHAFAAYLRTFFNQIKKLISRS